MTEPRDPDEDLVIIDVRSPGDRAPDPGRAGFARVRISLDGPLVSGLALIWMVALVVIVVSETVSSFDYARQYKYSLVSSVGWLKVSFIAQSASLSLVAATVIGLGLAAFAASRVMARVAMWIGVALAAWLVFAGGCGIASAVHGGRMLSITATSHVGYAFAEAAIIGLGLVVGVVAWLCLGIRDELDDGGEELAELS